MKLFKRLIISALLICFLPMNAGAQFIPVLTGKQEFTAIDKLQSFGGLTFAKIYSKLPTGPVTAAQLAADYSVGSATATYTVDRTGANVSPGTYVDDNGVVQLLSAVDDIARVQGGYYDATGFHAQKGLMIEAAGTNLLQDSYFADGTTTYWRSEFAGGVVSTTTERTNVYGGGQVLKIVGTDANFGMRTAVASQPTFVLGTVYTVSALVRGSGDARFKIAITGGASMVDTADTLQDGYWQKMTYTFTADVSNIGNVGIIRGGTSMTCYVAYIQLEASPYATSFIPTTTTALTRPADVLKYAIAGNRTAASESIFVKFAPEYNATSLTTAAWFFANDGTNNRIATVDTAGNDYRILFKPNLTAGPTVASETIVSINTSYTLAFISNSADVDPNALLYVDGASESVSYTPNTNFTPNDWSGNFYVGLRNNGLQQINGVYQGLAVYSGVKSAPDTSSITTILQNN